MFPKVKIIAIAALLSCSLGSTAAEAAFSIQPSLSLQEAYDSNPELRSRSEGVDGTFKGTITPSLSMRYTGKTYHFAGSYNMTSYFHHEKPALDYNVHAATISAYTDIGKQSSLSITDNYSLNKGVQITDEAVGIHLSRAPIEFNTVSLALSTKYGSYWSLSFTVSDARTEYDDPTLIDTVTNTASVGADYKLSNKTSINTDYSFSRYGFDASSGATSQEVQNVSFGLARALAPTVNGAFSSGLIYSNGFSGDFDWNLNASLTKKAAQYEASLNLSRKVSDPSGLADDVVIVNSISFTGKYSLKQKVTLNADATATHTRSQADTAVDIITLSTSASINWELNSNISLDLNLTRYNQWVDNSAATSMIRDQVYLSLTYRFKEWRL